MTENEDYYTGSDSNPVRRKLFQLWRKLHDTEVSDLWNVKFKPIPLGLDRYLLINGARDHSAMSTQLTGNTCYFQTYLFGVLCKVGVPSVTKNNVAFENVEKLEQTTIAIARFLLEFFVQESHHKTMRPLTNSAVVVDFFRHKGASYFRLMTRYLQHLKLEIPEYELQYRQLLAYFESEKTLHKYSKFTLSGAMPSTLNTKSLQPVTSADDGVHKLARANYYKYRAASRIQFIGFHRESARDH